MTVKSFLKLRKPTLVEVAACKFLEGVAILLAAKLLVLFIESAAAEMLLALFATLAVRFSIESVCATKFLKLSAEAQLAVRERLHAEIFRREIPTAELLTLIFDAARALDELFVKILPQVASTIILLPLFLLSALAVDWRTAAILLVTLPIAPVLLFLIGKATAERNAKAWAELQRLNGEFKEILAAITTLKMFGRIDAAALKLRLTSAKSSAATLEVLKLAFVSSFALELITTLSIALVAVTLGLRLVAGAVEFEAALFLLLIAPEFFAPIRKLGVMFHVAISARQAFERLKIFLGEPPEIPTSIGKLRVPPEISVEAVTFAYPLKKLPVLRDLTLKIPAGKITAIVGESGCGKSTLLKLLAGLVLPTAGEILFSGLPVSKFQRESLWAKVAYVPQAPHLFEATLGENLAMFGQLDTARLSELLAELNLPLELSSTNKISRGQLQRLGLIRALLKDSPVLILDEPTAGLDLETEAKVLSALKKFSSRRTIVIATHRQAVIDFADIVIELNNQDLYL